MAKKITIDDLAKITKAGFDGVDKRLDRVESTMVNKDYLDEKLADLRGDIVILLCKEDRKLEAPIEKLKKKHIITDKDIKELQEIQIFVQ